MMDGQTGAQHNGWAERQKFNMIDGQTERNST